MSGSSPDRYGGRVFPSVRLCPIATTGISASGAHEPVTELESSTCRQRCLQTADGEGSVRLSWLYRQASRAATVDSLSIQELGQAPPCSSAPSWSRAERRGWHSHPAHVFVLVRQGRVAVNEEGACTPTVYTKGEIFHEEPGHVHKAPTSETMSWS